MLWYKGCRACSRVYLYFILPNQSSSVFVFDLQDKPFVTGCVALKSDILLVVVTSAKRIQERRFNSNYRIKYGGLFQHAKSLSEQKRTLIFVLPLLRIPWNVSRERKHTFTSEVTENRKLNNRGKGACFNQLHVRFLLTR